MRRLLSVEEYSKLEALYKNGEISTLLDKDREIIKDLIQRSILNGKFIQRDFKIHYNFHCKSLLDILDEVENSLPITKWAKYSLSSELFAFPEVERINESLVQKNGIERQTHNKLKSTAIKYHAIRNEKDDTNALMLIFDWQNEKGTLQQDFYRFIDNEYDRSERNSIIEYLKNILAHF